MGNSLKEAGILLKHSAAYIVIIEKKIHSFVKSPFLAAIQRAAVTMNYSRMKIAYLCLLIHSGFIEDIIEWL